MKNIRRFLFSGMFLVLLLNCGCHGWTFFSYRTTYFFTFDMPEVELSNGELNAAQAEILDILMAVCQKNGYKFEGVKQERYLNSFQHGAKIRQESGHEPSPLDSENKPWQQEPIVAVYRFYNPALNVPCYYIPQKNKLILKEELPESERKEKLRGFISQLKDGFTAKKLKYSFETCVFRMSSLKGNTNFEDFDFDYEPSEYAVEHQIENYRGE